MLTGVGARRERGGRPLYSCHPFFPQRQAHQGQPPPVELRPGSKALYGRDPALTSRGVPKPKLLTPHTSPLNPDPKIRNPEPSSLDPEP